MKPFDETDLAAYHLGDLPSRRARLLEKALRTDANLAAESEVYESMLRNFKDHAPLEVDEDIVERNWQRIQNRLPRLRSTCALLAGTLGRFRRHRLDPCCCRVLPLHSLSCAGLPFNRASSRSTSSYSSPAVNRWVNYLRWLRLYHPTTGRA